MADKDTRYSGGEAALAFVVGALLGAGAALLLAPRSGAATRTLLKSYAEKTDEEVRERLQDALVTLETAVEQGKRFIHEKKALLAAAFEAGQEAMRQERERAAASAPGEGSSPARGIEH